MSTTSLLPQRVRPAAGVTPMLVYRDRIGAPSEIQFLRRQYVGFAQLSPVWVGRHIMTDAASLGGDVMRLAGDGPTGWLQRLLFRHVGRVPRLDIGPVANVLHAQFARGGALALPLAQALGLRLVVTLHGGDVSKTKNWRGTLQARRWPAVVAAAARFICVSRAVADMALAHGVPSDKIALLRIGVEMPAAPPAPPPARPAICSLAASSRRRGSRSWPAPSVVCAPRARQHAWCASATARCGRCWRRLPATREASSSPGGCRPMRWRGAWPRPGRCWFRVWSRADGDAEGLPSVIAEAMAQACPVIGSAEGGIAEVVQHGRTGLLVPPGDAAALADAMRRLVSEPELRHGLGMAAFAYASECLDARVQSVALENLLLEVAN